MAVNSVRSFCRIFSISKYTPSIVNIRNIKRSRRATLMELKRRQIICEEQLGKKKLLELTRRSNFVEWNRGAEIYAFGKRLQEDFRLDLLDQAFIHRSYIISEKQKMEELQVKTTEAEMKDNDYLAGIGHKIISNYVWNYFAHFFPRFPREGINAVYQHFTSDEFLAHISENLGTTHIILSADYPIETDTYSKTLKAIVGALMESQGIEKANTLVRDLVVAQFSGKDINDFLPFENYFEVLCSIYERDNLPKPEPRIICQSGVNTILANYHIGIYSDKKIIGHCSGESLDIATEMASLDALKRLFHTTDSAKPLRYDAVLSYEGKIMNNLTLDKWSTKAFENRRQ